MTASVPGRPSRTAVWLCWWLAPAFVIALGTLAFAGWVCADVWHTSSVVGS